MRTIAEIAPLVARGELTSEKLTEECLSQIEALNPKLNAFITITADDALGTARAADREIAGGRYRGPLHGIPFSFFFSELVLIILQLVSLLFIMP